MRAAAAALLVAAASVPLAQSWREAQVGGDLMDRVGARVRALPAGACYFGFEPAWALAGDRLPGSDPGRPAVVDVYGTLLLAGRGLGNDRDHAPDELRSRAAQERLRDLVRGCEYLSLGERGELELTPRTRRWIESRWEKLPAVDATGVDLWRLRTNPIARE
jgi:hypothetical protein